MFCRHGYSITLIKKYLKDQKKQSSIIDLFNSNNFNEIKLSNLFKKFKKVILVQENFENKGGLDNKIIYLKEKYKLSFKFNSISLKDEYTTIVGDRDYLLKKNGLNIPSINKIYNEK